MVEAQRFTKMTISKAKLFEFRNEFRNVCVCFLYSTFILNAHYQSIQLISDLKIKANIHSETVSYILIFWCLWRTKFIIFRNYTSVSHLFYQTDLEIIYV